MVLVVGYCSIQVIKSNNSNHTGLINYSLRGTGCETVAKKKKAKKLRSLRKQQEFFAKELPIDGNKTRAAKATGYKEQSAYSNTKTLIGDFYDVGT